jgi:hypothetical protein
MLHVFLSKTTGWVCPKKKKQQFDTPKLTAISQGKLGLTLLDFWVFKHHCQVSKNHILLNFTNQVR